MRVSWGGNLSAKKRHIAVDTQALALNFAITPADVQDRDMIAHVMGIAKRRHTDWSNVLVDGGFQGQANAEPVRFGADLAFKIAKRSAVKELVVLPKRRIVESTFG